MPTARESWVDRERRLARSFTPEGRNDRPGVPLPPPVNPFEGWTNPLQGLDLLAPQSTLGSIMSPDSLMRLGQIVRGPVDYSADPQLMMTGGAPMVGLDYMSRRVGDAYAAATEPATNPMAPRRAAAGHQVNNASGRSAGRAIPLNMLMDMAETVTRTGLPGGGGRPPRPPVNGRAVAQTLFPGVRVTSGYRGPNHQLSRANPGSYHARSHGAVDVAPIRGMTFEQYVEGYRRAGYNVIEARDEVANPSRHATGPHWHVVLGEQGGGAQAAGAPNMVSGYDPARLDGARGELAAAERAALTPVTMNNPMAPRPEMPDAPVLPTRDFSAQNALIEQMRPEADTQEETTARQRRGWLQGMAQGLLSVGEEAHAGRVLAVLGAGAMAGRQAADEEVAERADRFDGLMREWNTLRLGNENQQSEQRYSEAMGQVQATHAHNIARFNQQMQNYTADNQQSFDPNSGRLIRQTRVGNTMRTEVIPVAQIIRERFAMQRAQLAVTDAQMGQQADMANAQMANQLLISQSLSETEAEAAQEPVEYAQANIAMDVIESGAAARIFDGDPSWAAAEADVRASLQEEFGGRRDSEAAREALMNRLVPLLMARMANDPEVRNRVQRDAVVAARGVQRQAVQRRSRTERVDPRGRRTVTTRAEGD